MNSRGMIGYASERLVESDLLFQGIVVLNPSQPDLEYDLVAKIGNENFKIQVKTGKRKDDKVLVADIRKSASPRNPYKKLHYTKDDVDIFAITDPETRRVAYYPAGEVSREITFRFEKRKCRNGYAERLFNDFTDIKAAIEKLSSLQRIS
ncbi:group I intron-associated PD-(D/E)XK endonuclease [Bacillus velezensis]|uniref:group I intron-associated PD-(D/E)XK endonuclease n=1 Tax=Bacillus velezensis TaxID=492670 RepID=UPI000CF01A30|nr:group I intron-associated PD-(D/E)XK endonuclease [Bacillus velezensis]MCM3276337.1 group I intron-associated PD-(D/E)XK endonuclease [Bacillus velezensis]MCM3350115.1 group I intron-associated PD-(D/E)XK endonuclease [Bacillus velezensis]PQB13154.1 hypothetical protein C5O26_00630 [Bacillus velezensis]